MAPRLPRRPRAGDEDLDDAVHLDDEAHAWWAQRPVEELWQPRGEPASTEPVHLALPRLGDADEPTGDDHPLVGREPTDAYSVLGVEPSASWEEIVAAHRAMARRHHPDLVAGAGPAAVAAAEERIRAVNAAFAELRIRRGR